MNEGNIARAEKNNIGENTNQYKKLCFVVVLLLFPCLGSNDKTINYYYYYYFYYWPLFRKKIKNTINKIV